jgi:hypothetical protein
MIQRIKNMFRRRPRMSLRSVPVDPDVIEAAGEAISIALQDSRNQFEGGYHFVPDHPATHFDPHRSDSLSVEPDVASHDSGSSDSGSGGGGE